MNVLEQYKNMKFYRLHRVRDLKLEQKRQEKVCGLNLHTVLDFCQVQQQNDTPKEHSHIKTQ